MAVSLNAEAQSFSPERRISDGSVEFAMGDEDGVYGDVSWGTGYQWHPYEQPFTDFQVVGDLNGIPVFCVSAQENSGQSCPLPPGLAAPPGLEAEIPACRQMSHDAAMAVQTSGTRAKLRTSAARFVPRS